MSDYIGWANRISQLPIDTKGIRLDSHNEVGAVTLETGEILVKKEITDHVVYIPRINILGAIAYSLFDYHLGGERVTPNVCAVDHNNLLRQFVGGYSGELWRGRLYAEKTSLIGADLAIIDTILNSDSAFRIALLDIIFMCQDRSARNWLKQGKAKFWAIDNNMLWSYNGRHVDKRVIETGDVGHLEDPINAIVPEGGNRFVFGIGVFSFVWAGKRVGDPLRSLLFNFDWDEYFGDLARLITPLGYPKILLDDYRFGHLRRRVEWVTDKGHFPSYNELSNEWQKFIYKPGGGMGVWRRSWEWEK